MTFRPTTYRKVAFIVFNNNIFWMCFRWSPFFLLIWYSFNNSQLENRTWTLASLMSTFNELPFHMVVLGMENRFYSINLALRCSVLNRRRKVLGIRGTYCLNPSSNGFAFSLPVKLFMIKSTLSEKSWSVNGTCIEETVGLRCLKTFWGEYVQLYGN